MSHSWRVILRFGHVCQWLLAACVGPGSVARATSSSEWTALEPGLWYRGWKIEQADGGAPAAAHAFRVDPRVARLTVLDARREGRSIATLSALSAESKA